MILVTKKWISIIQTFFISFVGLYVVFNFSWLSKSDNHLLNTYSLAETPLVGLHIKENTNISPSNREGTSETRYILENNPSEKRDSIVLERRLKNENDQLRQQLKQKNSLLLTLMESSREKKAGRFFTANSTKILPQLNVKDQSADEKAATLSTIDGPVKDSKFSRIDRIVYYEDSKNRTQFTYPEQIEWNHSVVAIPAVYSEWDDWLPPWYINPNKWNISVFTYQRRDPKKEHYVPNMGGEAGVYLKFVIDFYDNLPDVSLFVHGRPDDHRPIMSNHLDWAGCIKPNILNGYHTVNILHIPRTTEWFGKFELWIEQCWRDLLAVVDIYPEPRKPIKVATYANQQFAITRDHLRRHPKKIYETLYEKIVLQGRCHVGEPDYEDLYAYVKYRKEVQKKEKDPNYNVSILIGEEPLSLNPYLEPWEFMGKAIHIPGYVIQSHSMEYLAHMIFGGLDYHEDHLWPCQEIYCKLYYFNGICEHSPCRTSDEMVAAGKYADQED